MSRLAVLSLHTSPLTQPGLGDGGGMNVYVRELGSALAQAGITTDVYTRRWADDLPEVVDVEPGLRVVHVAAGDPHLAKEDLPGIVDEFTDGVMKHLTPGVTAVHANYWLSGHVGHQLKHQLGLPLVSTFHTLARVKACTGDLEPDRRDESETKVIGCSDTIIANSSSEAHQLETLYGAKPDRIEIIPPGVDHAFFSPGPRDGARKALAHLHLGAGPVMLFVGRIQPLKRLGIAVETLAELNDSRAVLVVVGGASGAAGASEVDDVKRLAAELGVADQIRWVRPQPHHLLSSYYRAADLVLVPSRSESFGLVALEAAACGTPVVAAAVGGLRTLVEHGCTGFLVEDGNAQAYAASARKILENDTLAHSLSSAAVSMARTYTWSLAAGRLRRIYADLAAQVPVPC